MSEFLKKRRPRMTDEEERALWERVRTMPSEVARRRSPWAALWAKPAVRFGAPVFAVALVAVVWVAQRAPEAPRPGSTIGTVGTVGTAETEQRAKLQDAAPQDASDAPAPESAPAPAPTVGQDARMRMPAAATVMEEEAAEPAAPRRESANRADDEGSAGTAQSQSKEKATFAAPPAATSPAPPPAPAEKKAEGARVLAKSSAPASPEAARGEAATGAADLQAYRAMPEADPGITTRVTAIRSGDFTSRLLDDVVRPPGTEPFGTMLRLPVSGEVISLVRKGRTWEIYDDGLVLEGSLPPPGPIEKRAALAVDLIRAVEAKDRATIESVAAAAVVLRREQPTDAGVRALVAWAAAGLEVVPAR